MWGKNKCGALSHPDSCNALKCAQGVKRASCIVSHKRIEQKLFSVILIQAKHCQKIVQTSQPPLNVLHVFIIIEKKVWFNLFF